MNFNGAAYDPVLDHSRLVNQLEEIRGYMADGEYKTIKEISDATGHPENSVSAQLRNLRKPLFGGYRVERRYIEGTRISQYRVVRFDSNGQGVLL